MKSVCVLVIGGALLAACADLENLTGGGDDGPRRSSASCTAPDKPNCGAHGRCDDRGGTARCICDEGFRGASCNECADGLQDNDKDGTCSPTCEKAGLTCATHARCDDGTGTAQCACAPGYELTSNACAWRGGPKAAGWKLEGGATSGPGVARFAGEPACSGAAGIVQEFPMPRAADAEPFALEITATATSDEPITLGVYVNGVFIARPTMSENGTKTKVCLGDRAYGGDVELALRPRSDGACSANARLDIAEVAIVPDASCPVAGTFPNGDFESTGNWIPSTIAGNAGSTAEVATNVGTGGGRAGRLATTNVCQEPHLDATMSAPSVAMERVALAFTYKGTNAEAMTLSSGRLSSSASTFGEVSANATFQSAKLCMPEWAKGVIVPVTFTLEDFGGACAEPNLREFVFDDVAFVSEPSCPKEAFVLDGGFEGSTTVSPWILRHPTPYSTVAEIRRDGGARTGAGYLELGSGQACQDATARQTITVPQPRGNEGPAVKLWYRLPTVAKAAFSTTPGGGLTATAAWSKKTICLDPKRAGEPLVFTIEASGGSGTCATTFSVERLEVDDVEVTTDAGCKPR